MVADLKSEGIELPTIEVKYWYAFKEAAISRTSISVLTSTVRN